MDKVTPRRQDSLNIIEVISDEEQDNQKHTEEQQETKAKALTKLCEGFPWMSIWSGRKAFDPLQPLHCQQNAGY